ncbi:MAG: hypothetical protein EA339_04890 [Rhodobacteraceae bacterium]|nr:MAG: hypothetical protein EA339_04890 [Paracoccaceae bacterium]
MSDSTPPDDSGPEAQDTLLAAEYVLGTLPEPERRAARERIEVDGAFAALVGGWQARLEPLNDGYNDVPAPDLLDRIEARLFGAQHPTPKATFSGRRKYVPGWRGGALASLLAAGLVLVTLTFWPTPPTPITLQAELAAPENALRVEARWDSSAGLLELTRVAGNAAPSGQDYELWLISAEGVPRSLGLLQAQRMQLAADGLAAGLTLAISLEPEGGSPELTPTGPVLATATLAES